jgi:hypothetical protein
MIGRNEENLKELFEKFFSSEQAAKAFEDVYKAEQIIRQYPAPEPEKELIDSIKSEIAFSLLNRQAHVFRKAAFRIAAIAAAVIIVAAIGLNLLKKERIPSPQKPVYASIIPRAIWESTNIAADDRDLAIFTTEAEKIEDELLALQLGKGDTNADEAITKLELELMEIDSDFWKG